MLENEMTNQEAQERWGDFEACPLCGGSTFRECDNENCFRGWNERKKEEKGIICSGLTEKDPAHHIEHKWYVKKLKYQDNKSAKE